jgi:hypothetical protein
MFDHVNGKRQLERHLSWRPPCCNGPAPNLFRVLPKKNVNPARDRLVALTAIARRPKDQYDTLATPVPPHLAALVEQVGARKLLSSLMRYSHRR